MPAIAPYGSWKSPITADLIVQDTVRLGAVQLDGDDVYWVEMRPADGARNVIVRRTPDGAARDVTAAPFNVRTRVHEYGGLCFWVAAGVVWFANFADQRVYRQEPGAAPVAITPEGVDLRFGDGMIDWRRGRLVCVREDHRATGTEAVNAVVALDLAAGGAGDVLVAGSDFYGCPAVSPDGSRLAWLAWNHPHMPWDETELWVADLSADGAAGTAGAAGNLRKVAGGRGESVFQPEWSPDGVLHFASDRSGWWNLYRWRDGQREAEAMAPMRAEFGVPAWTLGSRTYAFASAGRIVCQYCEQGRWRLAVLDTRSKRLTPVEIPYTESSRGDIRAARGRVVMEAAAPNLPSCLVSLDLDLDGGAAARSSHATDEDEDGRPGSAGQPAVSARVTRLRQSQEVTVGAGYLSTPRAIAFETTGGETAHAIYYPPCNPDFEGPPEESPPLLVMSHGGPTGAASAALSLGTQFWTSRGIAVVDVNYGGSTGYGTAYRHRLNGRWGIVDVDDCVNAALHLVRAGEVDGARLLVTGGSAGGFTTLAALTFRDVFRAGASYYGISDLEALARDTHKFESRYLDSLVGPYPERRDRYLERSPIHHTGRLACPIILLQGLEDRIVLPNQAEMMVDAVRRKGLPVAYLPFPGEQHGFRKAENAKRALEAELFFYSRILGFTPADAIEPVAIENL